MRAPALLSVVLLAVLLMACVVPSNANLPAAQIFPVAEQVSGRILFVKDGNVWIWSEGRARQITAGETWQQPTWSPDGSAIAYVYRGSNFSEIFVMSADGSDPHRLTRSQSSSLPDNDWVFRPTWSPDGDQIAFITDAVSYHPVVWIMNSDGSGKRQLMPISSFHEAADALSWSPDGKHLAITAFGAEVSQIVLLDVTRGTTQPLTQASEGALDPAWSPDGKLLAYAVREGGRTAIRVRPLEGGSEVEVATVGYTRAPVWSPDGTRLGYLASRGGSFELYVTDIISDTGGLSAKNERQLTRDLGIDATSGLSWAR